ncbi:hypothetical protein [Paenibacillus radicis (ex Xue et al. 2023)]|uniref:Uncharacterized protein n=1 Tax=Paenibacillus radicis (ex Xue et al. 2023) TaxID=2972489 RepID=A0ABT1YSJ8_9BACL|nr:hypothetical protein [Paenibacillus radicis (ex Xue et al. 2023)]MCR8635263.1 hypothetical protein [Paenibacillus radicis (ex Xue et al. 2023)]
MQCGAEGKFLDLQSVTRSILQRNKQRDVLIVSTVSLAACVFARSFMEMAISLLAGAALIVAYFLIRRPYAPYLETQTIQNLLQHENIAIREGLLRDTEDAAKDLKSDDFKLAYEKLREIGYLISGNQVKVLKLMCLNHFVLRKDMDLELSTLVPDAFDPDFIRYLFEVSKVSPELVKRNVIDYTFKHREEIEALASGRAVIGQVVTAALRVNAYVIQYEQMIADFVDELPRERLIRLCRLVADRPDSFPVLYPKVKETVKLKYEADPELQGIL